MNKQQILDIIQTHQAQISDFAVQELFLFGSVARGEETENGDVDFLVNFNIGHVTATSHNSVE